MAPQNQTTTAGYLHHIVAGLLLIAPPLNANISTIVVETSKGELVDKWTILRIKQQKIKDEKKLLNIRNELAILDKAVKSHLPQTQEFHQLADTLQSVNDALWDIEDDIREKEAKNEFDQRFIDLARAVYFTNDERGNYKNIINRRFGSHLVEEKQYTEYKATPANNTPSTPPAAQHDHTTLLNEATHALQSRNHTEAHAKLSTILNEDPNHLMALATMGMLHEKAWDYEQAASCWRKAHALVPGNVELRYRLATIAQQIGNFDEAHTLTQQLYQINPKGLKIPLLMSSLRMEDWTRATELTDWSRQWKKNDSIADKAVLVNLKFCPGAHGFGDVFQLARIAKDIHLQGARQVIIQLVGCKNLKPLLSLCPEVDQVICEGDPLPAHDIAYTPSVAATMIRYAQQTTRSNTLVPYLHANAQLVDHWKQKLAGDGPIRIGICWERNMLLDFFTQKRRPCTRSMPSDALQPFANMGNVTFYNLQKNPAQQNTVEGLTIHTCGSDFDTVHGSFMDTAALMKNLDLVITVDTSLLHLAGALDVPVWGILPAGSDYRWLRSGTDTFWYPSMKLFRQKSFNDWYAMIKQIRVELDQFIAEQEAMSKS